MDYKALSVEIVVYIYIFIDLSEEKILHDGREEMNLLQKCCYYELNDFVRELLKRKVNANKMYGTKSTPPILLAAFHGNLELIDILVKANVRNFVPISM